MFAYLFLASLFIASDGGAQQFQSGSEKPVWTMEVIKVKPEMFGPTLGYLDDNWMRVREEAKRQGAVMSYYRIVEGNGDSDRSIMLLTEFKNPIAYGAREELFASIRKQRSKQFLYNTPGVLRPSRPEDLYEAMSTRVLQDYSDVDNARLRLLSKSIM
jgi:hypothetical protein